MSVQPLTMDSQPAPQRTAQKLRLTVRFKPGPVQMHGAEGLAVVGQPLEHPWARQVGLSRIQQLGDRRLNIVWLKTDGSLIGAWTAPSPTAGCPP